MLTIKLIFMKKVFDYSLILIDNLVWTAVVDFLDDDNVSIKWIWAVQNTTKIIEEQHFQKLCNTNV